MVAMFLLIYYQNKNYLPDIDNNRFIKKLFKNEIPSKIIIS